MATRTTLSVCLTIGLLLAVPVAADSHDGTKDPFERLLDQLTSAKADMDWYLAEVPSDDPRRAGKIESGTRLRDELASCATDLRSFITQIKALRKANADSLEALDGLDPDSDEHRTLKEKHDAKIASVRTDWSAARSKWGSHSPPCPSSATRAQKEVEQIRDRGWY